MSFVRTPSSKEPPEDILLSVSEMNAQALHRSASFVEEIFRVGKPSPKGDSVSIDRDAFESLRLRYPKKERVRTETQQPITYAFTWEEVIQWCQALEATTDLDKWVKSMVAQQQHNLNRDCTHCQKTHAKNKICYYWQEYKRHLVDVSSKV